MNPFVSRISKNSMVWAMSGMLLVLGFLGSLAWMTQKARVDRTSRLDPDQAGRISFGTIDTMESVLCAHQEVQSLRAQLAKLQTSVAENSGQGQLLNQSLKEAQRFAGLTPVEGPGIVITLRDVQNPTADMMIEATIIHDVDVLRVVNELWNSGAEAISINGQRVVATTGFRCVGPVMRVNDVPIASPVIIKALGDTDTLLGGMNLPGGIISELKETSPKMVTLEGAKKLELPSYSGSTKASVSKSTPPKTQETP